MAESINCSIILVFSFLFFFMKSKYPDLVTYLRLVKAKLLQIKFPSAGHVHWMFENERSLGDEQLKIRSDLTKQQIEIVFLMNFTNGKELIKHTYIFNLLKEYLKYSLKRWNCYHWIQHMILLFTINIYIVLLDVWQNLDWEWHLFLNMTL